MLYNQTDDPAPIGAGHLQIQCDQVPSCIHSNQHVKLRSRHLCIYTYHNKVVRQKHFLRYWPFVRETHRSPVKSPHKGQWRGAVMFSMICAWINGWVNNRHTSDLRRHGPYYGVIVMMTGTYWAILFASFVLSGYWRVWNFYFLPRWWLKRWFRY